MNIREDFIEEFSVVLWIVGIIAAFIIMWNITAYRDIDELKEKAPAFIETKGFIDVKFNSYWGGFTHGGNVGYFARDTNNYLYDVSVKEWRGELQISSISCLNAVTNQ